MPDLVQLLTASVSREASDLHITAAAPPLFRINGELVPAVDTPLTPEASQELVLSILSQSQRERLERDWELDFAVQVESIGRFRGNAHYSRGALEAAFRFIPQEIPELVTLGHRPSIFDICGLRRGLVLVTGITGSGKSTTLASMLQFISQQLPGVIITIEDPIEFLFENAKAVVKQREVGSDTQGFSEALRRAMRQDPDVILVGEMRDPETISAAVTAAETGHLVLATMHTIDAPKAIDRMVDAFPAEQQAQVVAQLSNCLEAVISQRLLRRSDTEGRCLASEILVANPAVRATIREKRWEQIVGLVEIGAKDGMHTIDDSLSELYTAGMISYDEMLANARDAGALADQYPPTE